MNQLFYRPFGSDQWKGPVRIDEQSVRGAEERAKHLTRLGTGGLQVGRLFDWRFLRNGACVHAWSMVVESVKP